MSRRKNNQNINVLLPETVITPNGSYTQFTGGEGFIPSLDYFKELEINKDRVNAVNKMLALEAPVDPHNPSMSYPSAALGVFGMSDDTRNYIFGNDNKRRTCLYTASSQYNDTPVASNRQFAANPEKYGFKEVDVKDAGVGDIVQFWENGKVPHHATVYTGNTPEGEPLISYSNGNTEAYREWKYPNGEYEVRGNIIKNRNISDGPVQDLGTQHYYRYIGSPQKHEQIERRYEMLKNGEHIYKDGGFLHPKGAWDELSLADKAKMMEVAVRNGITNLQEIKKKYNEFADGGNFNSLPDNWTMEDESAYRQWLSSLPDNLKSTDDSVYDMRRAFKAGMVPVLNEDGYYHLGSRDPQTGRILKAPIHPTYLQAITEDTRMGYYPTINDKGVTYTNTWKGNQFKGGGYTSSDSIRSRIAKYEGKAMTGAIDPLSGKWDKNRSFEAEDASFYAALPESIRGKVLANPDLADNLYSYSYNVGAGNFKKRVVPALEKYYQGKATVGDIERSMWASGDAKLRGLRTRRAEERAGVRAALDPTKPVIERPVSTTVFNPYALQQQNTVQLPQYIPSETEYIRTIEVSPEQQRAIQLQERFNQINRFNQLMKLAGIENTAIPAFMPETGVAMLDDIWNTGEYAKGGKIYIKPSHRGRLTELKKRTGKTEAELYNDGNPAHKKMVVFARNSRKWKYADGGHLYGGGGLTNIILGPRPGVTDNEDVRGILSWLPYTSTAIDIDNASKDPSASNLTWAGISTGLDLLSFGLASKIKRGIKAVEKAIEPAEKAATSATKRAERAKKVYEQAPTKKNYERNLKAGREAFEKNYVLNNQVDGLYKQLADEQWYKSTWLPIFDGYGGVASQGAQTIFEGVNTPQKALGGNLFSGEEEHSQQMQRASDYRYVLDDDGEWNRVANDEIGRVFQGLTVTPRKTKQKFVPERIDNSLEAAKAREKFFQYRDEEGHIKGEPSLEVVSPEFEILMGARMAMPTYSQQATKNYQVGRVMKVQPKNMPKVNKEFRSEEWGNFLNTRNGDNYYRMANIEKEIANGYFPKENYFVSHTTPWEEFSGMKGIEDPAMIGKNLPTFHNRLYEFPSKTFGTRKSSSWEGVLGDTNVDVMGKNHLYYGDTSSGVRGPVRVISDTNADYLGISPYKIGITDRPLTINGLYDKTPVYEDIYMGNQTVLNGKELQVAIQNSTYNIFDHIPLFFMGKDATPSGITKIIHINN